MFRCSYCMSPTEQILDLGFLPPVNVMSRIDENISLNTSYPLGISICQSCGLTQIINEIESALVFPESYPYLSGTTKILVKNFSEQAQEILSFKPLKSNQLMIDIGSNDGTLLKNYINTCKVLLPVC